MGGFINLEDVTKALNSTRVSPSGVSFEGKGLKLNSEEDVKPVIDAINNCKELQYLNLEGNTLGVDAAKHIAIALENHAEFKRALWKDMFTGRMKTEIPKALEFLGAGLVKAGAQLTELDLSDNAFGPIGVEGLASLLKSSSCYALEELRLNNNGLGIGGAKLLSSALLDCYKFSKEQGKPLALKVFIAGRNRLENEGAKALSVVFKTIGTLEEIAMPQNGIYHVGITALSDAFQNNKNLQILNLNDNTIGPKGAKAIADILPALPNIKDINFGDCLLKTRGATALAAGLRSCNKLESLIVDCNEIRTEGATELLNALADKQSLKVINLDGNQFGEQGKIDIYNLVKVIGKLNALGSLSENESAESEQEEDDEHESEPSSAEEEEPEPDIVEVNIKPQSKVSIEEFLLAPSAEKFIALGDNRAELLLKAANNKPENYIENFVPILMKVSAITKHKGPIADLSLKCSELLYRELFTWTQKNDKISVLNNALLVNLGLIKSEDKTYKPTWDMEGCLRTLESILNKNYIPDATRDTLKVFMEREIQNNSDFLIEKKKLLESLK